MKIAYSYITIALVSLIIGQASYAQELIPYRTAEGKFIYVERGESFEAAIDGEWDGAYLFYDGVARVQLDDKYGFINRSGEVIVKMHYDYAEDFKDGLAKVAVFNGKRNYLYGLIDNTGYAILPTIYNQIGNLSEDRIAVVKNEKLGFADRDGGFPIELKFDFYDTEVLPYFHEGMCAIGKFVNGTPATFGIINGNGYFMLPQTYETWGGAAMYNFPTFSEGLAVFKKNGKFGYMDESGTEIIPAVYDGAEMFSEGLAAVRLKDKIFFINMKGVQSFERTFGGYDEGIMGFTYGGFENGLAVVNLNTEGKANDWGGYSFKEKLGVINKAGTIVAQGLEVYNEENEHFLLEATSETEASLMVLKTGDIVLKKARMVLCEKSDIVQVKLNLNWEAPEYYFVDADGIIYLEK